MLEMNENTVNDKIYNESRKFSSATEETELPLNKNAGDESAEEYADNLQNKNSWETINGSKDNEIKFSKMELLQMLSSYEGELQARDEVIAVLKCGYVRGPAGRYNLTDSGPIRALARDSENLTMAMQSGNHLRSLNERGRGVVQHYKKSYEKLKKLHFALEKKYGRLLEDVGVERKINEEFRKKLNRLVKALEKDREELQKLLRDKAIMDTSEEETANQMRVAKAKFYRKRVKKLNCLDKALQKSIEECKAEQGTQRTENRQLANEVETLRKTILIMKKSEKDYHQIEEECVKLRTALQEELEQTKALRQQFHALQNENKKKIEIEKVINEAFARFEEVQQSYEEERRRQHVMELQVENFKQQAEKMYELEILSKSSECKFMQMQTTLRETKIEKNNLKTKLEEAQIKINEYEAQLQQLQKTKEADQDRIKENNTVSDLTRKLATYEENCAEDMKSLHLKLNAAEKAMNKIIQKEESSEVKEIVTSKQNLVISSQELKKLLSMQFDDVIVVTQSRDMNRSSRYLTLEFTNENILQEIKKLEAKNQQGKDNIGSDKNNNKTTKISFPAATSPTGSTKSADVTSKTKVTSLPGFQSSTKRIGLKKSGSISDLPMHRFQAKQTDSNRIITRPVTLHAKKANLQSKCLNINLKEATQEKVSQTTEIMAMTNLQASDLALSRKHVEKFSKMHSSNHTKQRPHSNDTGNTKKSTNTTQSGFASINKNSNQSSSLILRNTRSKLTKSLDIPGSSSAQRNPTNQKKDLETSKRRHSGSYYGGDPVTPTTPQQPMPKLPGAKLTATSGFNRSNSVGASAKPPASISKLRSSSASVQSSSRLQKLKSNQATSGKSKPHRTVASTR